MNVQNGFHHPNLTGPSWMQHQSLYSPLKSSSDFLQWNTRVYIGPFSHSGPSVSLLLSSKVFPWMKPILLQKEIYAIILGGIN